MKIVAAFSNLNELEMLLEEGADEVYCGLLKSQQLPTMNHRPNSKAMNLGSLEELENAIKTVHKKNAKISLVINEVGSFQSSLSGFVEKMKRIDSMGIDSFILSDIVLIEMLSKLRNDFELRARLTLSSVFPCLNTPTAQYVKRKGISRIVFPQHLYPEELRIIKGNVDIEAEVFFFGTNYCRNIDGFCFYTYNRHLWKGEIPLDACEKISCAEMHYAGKKSKWAAKKIFNSPLHQDMFGAVYDYYKSGADVLKLGNREAPTKQKLKVIRLARYMADLLKENKSRTCFVGKAKMRSLALLY